MRLLLRCWSILTVAAKRLSAQRTLAAASTLGWILAVALTVSVPAYADAVYARMFLRHVARAEENADSIPLLGYLFRYSAASHTPKQWEDIQPVDAYLSHQAAETIGLPLAFLGRYVQTDPFALFPQGQTTFDVRSTPLLWASFGWISDLSSHIVIAEGRYPSETSDATQGQPVERWPPDLASRLARSIQPSSETSEMVLKSQQPYPSKLSGSGTPLILMNRSGSLTLAHSRRDFS